MSAAPARAHRARAGVRVRILALLVVAAPLALAGALAAAPPADAHAVLVDSSPRDGARLAVSPPSVDLTFDEPVRLPDSGARVLSSSGSRVDTGRATTVSGGRAVRIPLRPGLRRDSYTATWRVVSADSHVVTGSISFGVRQAARSTARATTTAPTSLDVASSVARGVGYGGAILLIGIPLAGVVLRPRALLLRRVRGLVVAGGAAVAADAVIELLLTGPRSTASGWAGAVRFDALPASLASLDGVAFLVRVGAAIVTVGFALRLAHRTGEGVRRSVPACVVAAVGAVVVAAAFAVVGHAAAGDDAALAIPVTTLHVLAMTAWLGGLALLLVGVLPHRAREDDPRPLGRWSVLAFAAVGVLVLTGEYQSLRMLTPLDALWSTGYGLTLVVKSALVAVAIAVAVLVRRWSVRGDPSRMRRAVLLEASVTVAVVVATTVLVGQPSPDSVYGPPAQASAPLGRSELEVHVASTHRGPQEIRVTARGAADEPLRLDGLSGTLSSDDAGVASLDVRFRRSGRGWESVGATAPLPGLWTLTLTVSGADGADIVTRTSYRVW